MNCQEFEAVVVDLARGSLADAAARERSLAHPDSCARCAARLAAERALCAGLRAAAATEASAPPRVEAALLAAFRARHAAAANANGATTRAATLNLVSSEAATNNDTHAAPQTTPAQPGATAGAASNVLSLEEAAARVNARKAADASGGAARGSSSGWWLRVAAALLVAATAGMTARLVWKSEQETGSERALVQTNLGGDAAARANGVAAEEGRAVAVTETTNAPGLPEARPASAGYRNVLMPDVTAGDDEGRAAEASPRFDARRQAGATPRHAARGRGAGRLSREALGALVANSRSDGATEAEVTTDFFPLSDASALPALEGGHVVRVELPRAALLSFGLPVNAEQATGRVKADVLIGHDGLARAVRFVR